MKAPLLTDDQVRALKRVRISPVMVRSATRGRVASGPGDMRVLKGLEKRGLVEQRVDVVGLVYVITDAGREALEEKKNPRDGLTVIQEHRLRMQRLRVVAPPKRRALTTTQKAQGFTLEKHEVPRYEQHGVKSILATTWILRLHGRSVDSSSRLDDVLRTADEMASDLAARHRRGS